MANNALDFSFKLAIATRLDEETGVHVGYCPALGIYSQGRSSIEAEEAVASALTLYVGACYSRGILNDILCSKGFTEAATGAQINSVEQEYITVNGYDRATTRSIPLHLLSTRIENVPCGSVTH